MPRPEPIWERWKKNPKTAERLYIAYWAATIIVNLLIVIGFVVFIVLFLKSKIK